MSEMTNKDIAALLSEIAKMMEINGENKFKVRAYYNASRRLGGLTVDLNTIAREDKLEQISGIGKGIAETIKEILENGYSPLLEDIRSNLPEGIIELIQLPGLGPKKAHQLYKELGIDNIEKLRDALKNGMIRELKGFGKKSEEKLDKALRDFEAFSQVHILYKALLKSEEIKLLLEKYSKISRLETVGSVRRCRELVTDIDILTVSESGQELIDFFVNLPMVKEIIVKGEKKASIITDDNFQVDLRIVSEDEYPTALLYFTGSREHNLKIKERGKKFGYNLNQYGLFKGEKRVVLNEEADIYRLLDMDYIIPELREDRGEIRAAEDNKLPDSVRLRDIKGDLHLHTIYTDGAHSIEELIIEARRREYKYIAITDHSRSLKVAHGMSIGTLLKQLKEIEKLQEKYDDIQILRGIEVDIDTRGKLDYPDEILARLDIVIASIHSGFNQSQEEITERIIKAMENPYVNIIGHLRGRVFKKRGSYPLDIERIIEIAGDTSTCLEINASPYRLDIDDIICRQARDRGVKIVINTDSHHLSEFDNMLLGVAVARRGWLEKGDIINTMAYEELKTFLQV